MKAFGGVKNYLKTIFVDLIASKVDGRYQIFDNAFYFDEVKKDHIILPSGQKFYGVEVSHLSNIDTPCSSIVGILNQHSDNEGAQIHLFLTKNKFDLEDGIVADQDKYRIAKESFYLFTPIKEIAKDIAACYDTKIMSGLEIIRAIFDIAQLNKYYVNKETFDLESSINYDILPFSDPIKFGFRKSFAEGVYKEAKNYRLFVSNSVYIKKRRVDYHSLMSTNWHGYFYFYFDAFANRIAQKAKFYYNEAKSFEPDEEIRRAAKIFYELVNSSEKENLLICQSMALVDNPSIVAQTGGLIGVEYIEKSLFKKDIIYKTPLRERDLDFDIFVLKDKVEDFVKSIHKRFNLKTRRPNSIWGRDISGNFISYSFSESASPHFGIFAKTRSGKSFFLQKAVTQIMRYDVNSEKRFAKRLGGDNGVKIRYFDIGESARKLVLDLLERHRDKVLFYGDDVSKIRFSFTDIEKDESGLLLEEDLEFMMFIMDIVLNLNGETELTASEKAAIKRAMKQVHYNKEYDGMTLDRLKTIGYGDIVDEIYAKYPHLRKDEFLKTLDLPDEYSYLKQPILEDIISYMEIEEQNLTVLDEVERDTIRRAKNKLRSINSIEMFKYYNRGSIENRDFFYIELNNLKSLGEKLFIPSFWFIFRRIYNNDLKEASLKKRKGLKTPEKYYFIEEAHNFVKFEAFRSLLDVISREAAKYNIFIGYVTQYIADLPESLITSLGTKIIMPSPDKKEQLRDLSVIWKGPKQNYMDFFEDKAERFTAFIDYDHGLITIRPPISKEELWLFNSEA